MWKWFEAVGIPTIVPEASSFATDWEQIFWYINVVTTVAGILVYACIVYFCFAYARTPGVPRQTPRILGSNKVEIAWTLTPLFFFLTFFVGGVKIYNDLIQVPADAPEYFVVGKQWMWKIQHPDGQREINELHVAAGTAIRMTGTSEDVIHDFGIPAFRSKMDVLPGRYTTTWYKPTEVGTYHIFCDQYCGMGHSQMVGKVHVLTPAEYEAWKEGTFRSKLGKLPVDGSPAWEGRKLFLKLQCNGCHNSENTQRAPRLEEMFGTYRPLQGGQTVRFDADYIKQSIRNPDAKVADGWKPIMPNFPVGVVGEIELRNLVAYIKSLKRGDLPSRNESYPEPVGAPGAPTSEGGKSK
jgi:cytochrome c oxidase subunit 2